MFRRHLRHLFDSDDEEDADSSYPSTRVAKVSHATVEKDNRSAPSTFHSHGAAFISSQEQATSKKQAVSISSSTSARDVDNDNDEDGDTDTDTDSDEELMSTLHLYGRAQKLVDMHQQERNPVKSTYQPTDPIQQLRASNTLRLRASISKKLGEPSFLRNAFHNPKKMFLQPVQERGTYSSFTPPSRLRSSSSKDATTHHSKRRGASSIDPSSSSSSSHTVSTHGKSYEPSLAFQRAKLLASSSATASTTSAYRTPRGDPTIATGSPSRSIALQQNVPYHLKQAASRMEEEYVNKRSLLQQTVTAQAEKLSDQLDEDIHKLLYQKSYSTPADFYRSSMRSRPLSATAFSSSINSNGTYPAAAVSQSQSQLQSQSSLLLEHSNYRPRATNSAAVRIHSRHPHYSQAYYQEQHRSSSGATAAAATATATVKLSASFTPSSHRLKSSTSSLYAEPMDSPSSRRKRMRSVRSPTPSDKLKHLQHYLAAHQDQQVMLSRARGLFRA